jgi:hypothetical protein
MMSACVEASITLKLSSGLGIGRRKWRINADKFYYILTVHTPQAAILNGVRSSKGNRLCVPCDSHSLWRLFPKISLNDLTL